MANRRAAVRVVGGLLLLGTIVFAHEGHKAISTKGVAFGPKSGKLFMEPPSRAAVGLTTVKVDFATIEETLRVPARLILPSRAQAFASARIGGVVESIRVKPGDVVKAGDVLAELSSPELDAMQSELTQRILEKRLVEENLARARSLGERIVAGKDVLELETELADRESARRLLVEKLGAVGLSEAQIDALAARGETTRRLEIAAPLGGHVVHVDTAIGAAVEPMRHLVEIHDLSTLWVQGEVPESRLWRVEGGMDLRVTLIDRKSVV